MLGPEPGLLPLQQPPRVVTHPRSRDVERRADSRKIQLEMIAGLHDDEILGGDSNALARKSRRVVREAGLARQHDAQSVIDKKHRRVPK